MPANKIIKVHYCNEISRNHPIKQVEGSDWIDLYTSSDIEMCGGDYKLIPLGVCVKLPRGYEAIIAPRSSTYKKWGLICANSIGIIDNAYCGQNDEWHFPAICLKASVTIPAGTRICQFRIIRNMPAFDTEPVEYLTDKNRGGFGSTGD